jgi:hypothetical protein
LLPRIAQFVPAAPVARNGAARQDDKGVCKQTDVGQRLGAIETIHAVAVLQCDIFRKQGACANEILQKKAFFVQPRDGRDRAVC